MIAPITFLVTGEPKAQPRPKAFARKFGAKWQARVYDPGTAEGWKSLIAEAVKPHLPAVPLDGPLKVTAIFLLPRPKAHYRSNGELKPNAPEWQVSKPDKDNLEKALYDALTQCGLWRDDSQVAVSICQKKYANVRPGAQVTVEGL
jgi:Holliday junction resolvase RusA-like endonuclease